LVLGYAFVLDDSSPDLTKIQSQIKAKKLAKKKSCFWPWNSMVVYGMGRFLHIVENIIIWEMYLKLQLI